MKKFSFCMMMLCVVCIICIACSKTPGGKLPDGDKDHDSKILPDIVMAEISLLDENSAEGLLYMAPVVIEDAAVIGELTDIVNSSDLYPESEFTAKYGAGGYFEGCPIVTLYGKDGERYYLSAIDDFDPEETEKVDLFYICRLDDMSDKVLYRSSAPLESRIKNIASEHGIPSQLEVDEDLRLFLQYAAFLNQARDVHYDMSTPGIMLTLASYYTPYTATGPYEVSTYKLSEIEKAHFEMFGTSLDTKTEGIFGLIYDPVLDSFAYESGGDGWCSTYLVKVEEQSYHSGAYTIQYVYAYADETVLAFNELEEMDCFRTTAVIQKNDEYSYCRYRLVNADSISSTPAGKVKDYTRTAE